MLFRLQTFRWVLLVSWVSQSLLSCGPDKRDEAVPPPPPPVVDPPTPNPPPPPRSPENRPKKRQVPTGVQPGSGPSWASKVEDDQVTYDLDTFLLPTEAISREKEELINRLNQKQAVSFKLLTRQLIDDHIKAYRKESGEDVAMAVKSLVDKMVGAIGDERDPHQQKLRYEAAYKKIQGQDAKYYRESTTLGHIQAKKELQCYSGTVLHTVITRQISQYRQTNPVIIFEEGHVLPGYMKKVGDEWHLHGIESTALGRAEILYGSAKTIGKEIRVVDAEYFVLMELLKNHLKHKNSVASKMLNLTAKRYDLTHISGAFIGLGPSQGVDQDKPNHSPFAFGKAQVPDEVIERINIDQQSPSDPRGKAVHHAEQVEELGNGLSIPDEPDLHCMGAWPKHPDYEGCFDRESELLFSYAQPIEAKQFESAVLSEPTAEQINQLMKIRCAEQAPPEVEPEEVTLGDWLTSQNKERRAKVMRSLRGGGSLFGNSLLFDQEVNVKFEASLVRAILDRNIDGFRGHSIFVNGNKFVDPSGQPSLAETLEDLPNPLVGVCVYDLSKQTDAPDLSSW